MCGEEGTWEISVSFSQFYHESKTSLLKTISKTKHTTTKNL